MSLRTGAPLVLGGSRGGGGLEYRPWLDGLRVVAVYLVVLFHGGSDRFSGGFVGVDVFFVLSGFLVTRLLLRDLVGLGRVGFRRFYARRFRRLLPAAVVVLVVSALVFSALASPVEVAASEGGFRAAFLYSTNWYFIGQSADYFGADLATNPVLHFWSLAVEEQFYLLWPLVLGGLFGLSRRFGARQWLVLRVVVAAGLVGSLVWAWSLRSSDPTRAYYGTDTRAYQLMAGALIALVPGLVARLGRFVGVARVAAAVGLVGLVVLSSSWVGLDAIERGVAVTAVTVVVIVALETASGGVAHRVLSVAPVVYLGKISYATYLWHWPVIWVMARSFDLSVVTTIAVTALVATALASLSFQLMEHPVRVSGLLDRYRSPVIATGLALSLAGALVVIPAIIEPSTTTSSATPTPGSGLATTGFTPIPTDLDFEAIKTDFPTISNCFEQPATACTLTQGTGPHILLMGDSHAGMLIPTLSAIATRDDLTLSVSTRGGCPWQRGLYRVPLTIVGLPQPIEDCQRHKDDVYDRVIPALDPDIIVAINVDYAALKLQYVGPDQRLLENDSPEYDAWLEETTVSSLDQLRAHGRNVLVIEPIPAAPVRLNPLTCLSTATVVEQCRYVVDPGPSGLELLYRQLDQADDRVWAADLDTLVCPYLPICDPIVDHQVVKFDGSHLTSTYARSLAPTFADFLETNGILAR